MIIIDLLTETHVLISHSIYLSYLTRIFVCRSYASTEMNAESSRSHVIFRLMIEVKDKIGIGSSSDSGNSTGSLGRISYLNLVDLAGSERQKLTGSSGTTLKEGANINKSLLALVRGTRND